MALNGLVVLIEENLSSTRHHDQRAGWKPLHFNNAVHLVFFVFAEEERHTHVEFVQNAAERPHVNRWTVSDAEHDLRCSVVPRLNVGVELLHFVGTAAEVDHLDSALVRLAQEDIFRFHVTVHHILFFQETQRDQQLDRKATHQRLTDALKVISAQEIVQIERQHFKGQDQVFAEHETVDDAHNSLLVVRVLLI